VAEGIFQTAYDVYYEWRIADYQRQRLRELLDWFNENLPAPTRFSRKRHAIRNKQSGVCWFKDSARQQLQMI
jgi:hypothetical protein